MANDIELPPPNTEHPFPLMLALKQRRTRRKWTDKPLTQQQLANLLWAACGETQQEGPRSKSKRTAPSARNSQAIKVYVALSSGLYCYNEHLNRLEQRSSNDLRQHIGTQKMMKSAPAGLIYVADFEKLKGYTGKDDGQRWFIAGTEVGFISQNIYLYCAAAKLSTAIIGLVSRPELEQLMQLAPRQKVVYTQVVGNQAD